MVFICDPSVVLYSVPLLQSGKTGSKICVTIWKYSGYTISDIFRKQRHLKVVFSGSQC